jgi:hypothetical protein
MMKKKAKPTGNFSTLEQFVGREIRRRKELKRSPRWGEWRLNAKALTLTHSQTNYEISLDEMTDSAQILDWVFQIQAKAWATPDTVSSLLDALADLLDPQANYCSGGVGRSCNPREAIASFFALGGT